MSDLGSHTSMFLARADVLETIWQNIANALRTDEQESPHG